MRRYFTVFELCLLLLISGLAGAQVATTPKTLLWRISGHGLQKPSYLYGTMHLTDKRLFQFGDSVYHAIEHCDGLAIEVNPDELAAYYVNRLFDQMETGKKLQDILQADDFKKYSSSLAKKFNKPAAEITARDIVKEKNKWMSDYMEKGEMPTFVDAYLYNIARRQGKWLGGIEDITDQAGLLEDMVDKSDIEYLLAGDRGTGQAKEINKGMEYMISLYTSQDIDGIEAFSNGHTSPEKKDRILIKRNLKMARRIDSLTSLRSMFLAIGAAHLPGDTGVIDLLRKRGFTVDPVFSSRRMNEKEYTFKEVSIPWYPVDDPQGLYHTSMPGNPAAVKVFGLVDMKFLMDMISMRGFCTMAVPSAADIAGNDTIYDGLAQRMFQSEHIKPGKTVYNDKLAGREYAQEKKGANLRMQVFVYKKIMYISFMYALKPDALYGDAPDKFFNALVINKQATVSARSSLFTDSLMGISFTAPAVMTYNKKLSTLNDASWMINTFTGTDMNSGTFIMVFSKEIRPGFFITADSIIYKDLTNNLMKQYTMAKTEEKQVNGHTAIKISGRNILQPGYYMTAETFLQNGRHVIVMAITDSAHLHEPAIDRVFESLQMVPHPEAKWQLYSSADGRFSSQAPAPFQSYRHSKDGSEQIYAYDTTTSVSYSIVPDTLSKYFWTKDDSSYWQKIVTANTGEDSLVGEIKVNNGGLQGVELLLRAPKNLTRYKRMRLLQDGDKLYKLFVSAERDFLYSPHTNDFFNAFTVHNPAGNPLFYITPKTDLLLRDLAGSDSAARYDAYKALSSASFTEHDRQALQEAVFKPYYSLYDSTMAAVINWHIAEKLALLPGNATVGFVKSRYSLFTERKDTLKNIALTLLGKIKTKESFMAFAQLLKESAPRQPFDYYFTNALMDTLALTAAVYPDLQQLATDTMHAGNIARIANALLDSGQLKLPEIQKAENAFIHAAQQLLPAQLRGNLYEYNIYQLLTLLGKFKSAASNTVLKNYLSVKNAWVKKAAAIELLKNDQPPPVAVFNRLAADKATRYSLYNDLKEIGRQKIFPVPYYTQAHFAEAAAYLAATDDEEDYLSGMTFLYKRTAVYKNKTYVFYLYKVVFDGDDASNTFLGIAGGYAVNSTGIETSIDLSGVYREKKLDAKNAGGLLTAYLKELETNSEEAPPVE